MIRPAEGVPGSPRWWQTGAVYEIYPRSFADANGDVGDLAGVTGRLDYLAWLGIDAIWLAPFYPSPMADFGYDVADYTDVDRRFGFLADFDELLAAAHSRGIRVVVDYVPNHTSDQHPWFIESRSSRTVRGASGTTGATPVRRASSRTTGSACSPARPGSGTRERASSTCTPS